VAFVPMSPRQGLCGDLGEHAYLTPDSFLNVNTPCRVACEHYLLQLMLDLASSSRSQVAVPTASAATCLAWETLSAKVRWRPWLSVAIVTHLVTQPPSIRAWIPWSNRRSSVLPRLSWAWAAP
jgi:hypothetical protein